LNIARASSMMQLKTESYLNAKLSDIALGTSAAPTYFPSHEFQNDGVSFDLADGALAANNPVNIPPPNNLISFRNRGLRRFKYHFFLSLSDMSFKNKTMTNMLQSRSGQKF